MATREKPSDRAAPSIRRHWGWSFRPAPDKEPAPRPEVRKAVILDRPPDRTYTLSVLLSLLRR